MIQKKFKRAINSFHNKKEVIKLIKDLGLVMVETKNSPVAFKKVS